MLLGFHGNKLTIQVGTIKLKLKLQWKITQLQIKITLGILAQLLLPPTLVAAGTYTSINGGVEG